MTFRCDVCFATYLSRQGLTRHLIREHHRAYHSSGVSTPIPDADLPTAMERVRRSSMNSRQRRRATFSGATSAATRPADQGSVFVVRSGNADEWVQPSVPVESADVDLFEEFLMPAVQDVGVQVDPPARQVWGPRNLPGGLRLADVAAAALDHPGASVDVLVRLLMAQASSSITSSSAIRILETAVTSAAVAVDLFRQRVAETYTCALRIDPTGTLGAHNVAAYLDRFGNRPPSTVTPTHPADEDDYTGPADSDDDPYQ